MVPFHLCKLLPRLILAKNLGQLRPIRRTLPVQSGNRLDEILRDLAEDVHLQRGPKDAEVPKKHITYSILPHSRGVDRCEGSLLRVVHLEAKACDYKDKGSVHSALVIINGSIIDKSYVDQGPSFFPL